MCCALVQTTNVRLGHRLRNGVFFWVLCGTRLETNSMNFFGRKKPKAAEVPAAPPPPKAAKNKLTPQKGVETIRKQLTTLEKREDFLQKKINHQLAEAKTKSKKGDKKGAMFCLKRKKMYEKEIDKLSGMRMNLEQQMMALESASINADAFSAMSAGSKAMQSLQKQVNIERVEDITDDIQDSMMQAEEVSNAISQPMGGEMYDDDDLLNELEDMEAAELDRELIESESTPAAAAAAPAAAKKMPVLPSAPDAAVEEEDEDAAELARLQVRATRLDSLILTISVFDSFMLMSVCVLHPFGMKIQY